MYKRIKNVCEKKGYRFFNFGEYNLNIVGVRNNDTSSNNFNDDLYLLYLVKGEEQALCFSMTTDPGEYWRENPMNVDGCAIVKPGQYPGLWKIGKHQNKYDALVQHRLITVYRDNDNNESLDVETALEQTGMFGINCHRANSASKSIRVDKWSAGCQVLADPLDFNILMALAYKSKSIWGNSFTYTLLTEDELWNR